MKVLEKESVKLENDIDNTKEEKASLLKEIMQSE